MALDFPSLPAVGQKYPQPPITGVPVYSWDGEKWTTYGGLLTPSGPADALPLMDATPAAVGTSMEYAREDHVHPTDTSRAPLDSPVLTGNPQAPTPAAADADTSIATTAFVTSAVGTAVGTLPTSYVRYDTPQTLTSPQLIQARTNIYAAPFDALAYNGMQINGGMEVSQEFGGAGVTPPNGASKYVIDGWRIGSTGPQVMLGFQNPNQGVPPACLQVTVSTANASPAAGDVAYLAQTMEGYRIRRLNFGTADAAPVTLAFWVRAVRPGNYSGSINNGALDRSYPFSFTVSASNVWEYKTITIPGDTTGTWAKDNTIGMWLFFCLMSGTQRLSSANSWQAGQFFGVTGTVNGVAATSDGFAVSGVILLPGNEAPSAARSPLIMRPYGQELLTCQRYFYNGIQAGIGIVQSPTSAVRCSWPHPIRMRVVPTVTMSVAVTIYDGTGLSGVNPTITQQCTTDVFSINLTCAGGFTIGRPVMIVPDYGGQISVDARL